jgi:phage tail-like protein
MSVAFSSQLIQIDLTPMQLPEGASGQQNVWQSDSSADTPNSYRLRVTPGECSQLLFQVKNLANRDLRLMTRVVGDFPREWLVGRFTAATELELGGNRIEQIGFNLSDWQGLDEVLPDGTDALSLPANVQNLQTPDISGHAPADSTAKPAKIFETRTATKQPLQIDYYGQVLVYLCDHQGDEALALPIDPGSTLVGSVNFTVHLRPRSLYLDFLPAIYREVDFIGRFLKVFEQGFEPSVDILQSFWAYLDPHTAPTSLLPFLAYWVGWPGQVPWDEAAQRQLIRRALEIYRWRGTSYGLRLYLHLYSDLPEDQILIEESFTRSFELGKSSLGPATMLGSGKPYHFTVRLKAPDPELLDQELIRRIIEQEKPAFCTYDLRLETA